MARSIYNKLFGEIEFKEIEDVIVDFKVEQNNENGTKTIVFNSTSAVGHLFGNWYSIIIEITCPLQHKFKYESSETVKKLLEKKDPVTDIVVVGQDSNFIWANKKFDQKTFFSNKE